MFQRRRPPQLTVHDELRQTYADSCDISIKNLTLEEQNKVEDALKGWKSLHTSLLFKLELFAKNMAKMNTDELEVFNELKAIRDENVKHLIRVQLRVDELRRRGQKEGKERDASATSPSNSFNGTTNHKSMSVPSLRNSGGIRSLNSGSKGKKPLLKSLRPQSQTQQAQNSTKLPTRRGQAQASVAAAVSWQKPAPRVQVEDETFEDFDQDLQVDWDQIRDDNDAEDDEDADFMDYYRKDTQEKDSSPNLIDLDSSVGRSMENLSLGPKYNIQNLSTGNLPIKPETSPYKSETSPYRPDAKPSERQNSTELVAEPKPVPKKYVYAKPKPMNINNLMKKASSKPAAKSSPQKTSSPARPAQLAQKEPPRLAVPSKSSSSVPVSSNGTKKSNITYNYVVKSKKPDARPAAGERAKSKPVSSSSSDEELDMTDLTNPKVQDQIISEIRGIDVASAKQIFNDIIVHGDEVYWDDIVGLDSAKSSLKEAVVYPFLRPDLFRGLREPTRGMLLFGPPGTGKTMLARAVATESKSIFFSITSSSITSKYLGESEKLVRALFLLAKRLSPSIVFIDEIDSLLGSRTEGEIESIRRIKNEFLIQWSELSSSTTKENDANDLKHQVLILGATNLPWAIDEAARRRFVKRQYIPLPEEETRGNQIRRLLKYQKHTLTEDDFDTIIKLTDKFSGSDITALCKDSAMGPLRSLGELLLSTPTEEIRPMNVDDFKSSLKFIKPSVGADSLGRYEEWARKYGSSGV